MTIPRAACAIAITAAMSPSLQAGGLNASLIGQWDGFPGTYADVWGEGEVAVLGHFGSAGVDIIDISDPTNPVRAFAYPLPPPNASASAQDVKLHDGLLFIALEGSGNSVHIVDARNPNAPVGLVDIALAGMTAIHNVFFDRGYLYIVDSGSPRVAIVDLTTFDPDSPPLIPISEVKWMLEGVGSSFVHDITVVDNRMYASAWDSGIWIYDVTNIDIEPPQLLGSGPGNNTHSCWPTDDGAYVITGEERTGGGITAYRIDENPDGTVTLQVTDALALPTSEASSVHNQTVIGYRVFNSWYAAGLRVYDLDPVTGQFTAVAFLDPPGFGPAWGVYPFLGQDRVLVSNMSDGLLVVNVTAPISADLDGDGFVGVTDLLQLLAAWGPCPGCPEDLTGDGAVGTEDLLILLASWG